MFRSVVSKRPINLIHAEAVAGAGRQDELDKLAVGAGRLARGCMRG